MRPRLPGGRQRGANSTRFPLNKVEEYMSDSNCNRREFLALTSLALAVPAISTVSFSETPALVRCLVYDDQGQPLPAAGFERFHLCDQLMRPFTTPIEVSSGEV